MASIARKHVEQNVEEIVMDKHICDECPGHYQASRDVGRDSQPYERRFKTNTCECEYNPEASQHDKHSEIHNEKTPHDSSCGIFFLYTINKSCHLSLLSFANTKLSATRTTSLRGGQSGQLMLECRQLQRTIQ